MDVPTVLVLVAALLTAISLFGGVVSMAHGGAADAHRSHWLTFGRVGWQRLAALFLLSALLAQPK
jgi:hypothetical protein